MARDSRALWRTAVVGFVCTLGVSVAVAVAADAPVPPPVPPAPAVTSPPPLPEDSGVVEDLSPPAHPPGRPGLPSRAGLPPRADLPPRTDLPPRAAGGPPRAGGGPGGPRGATGDGADDFGSCRDEGRSLCAQVYEPGYVPQASWKLDLVRCLGDHRAQLSSACQASLDRRADLNTQVNEACRSERGRLCPGVRPQPGSEAGNACLREHIAEVNPSCRAALEAHEAAKPRR